MLINIRETFVQDRGAGTADLKHLYHFVVIHRRSPFAARLCPEQSDAVVACDQQLAALSCGCRTGFWRSHDSRINLGSWSELVQGPQPVLQGNDAEDLA